MAWKVVDQSRRNQERAKAHANRLTLRDGTGREANISIRAAEGASLSASDAPATVEPHLDRSVLPECPVFGADWPNDLP